MCGDRLAASLSVHKIFSVPRCGQCGHAAGRAWDNAEANNRLVKLQAANKRLAEEYGISSTAVFASQGTGGAIIGTPGGSAVGTGGAKNKFQAEDDWLALEQSKTLASYATGLIDYNQYNEKKAELDKQYLLKKLQNTEATEQEIAEITGE